MLVNLLKLLNSESDPSQISLAFAFALIPGLTPLFSIHSLIVFLIVFLLRVNLSAFLLGTAFFTGVAYLLDPLFHRIGLALLTMESLRGFWTGLYNSTLWRIERFNNSVIMGSIVCSLVLFIPLVVISNYLIRKYREHILAWVNKSRIMQAIKASDWYALYQKVSGWGFGS